VSAELSATGSDRACGVCGEVESAATAASLVEVSAELSATGSDRPCGEVESAASLVEVSAELSATGSDRPCGEVESAASLVEVSAELSATGSDQACGEVEDSDVDQLDSETDVSEHNEQRKQRKTADRSQRLQRRKIRILRQKMSSFKPPKKVRVYTRVIPPPWSDSDVDEVPLATNNSCAEPVVQHRTSRKRMRNPQLWKRNAIKAARERGDGYTNYRNVAVPAKKPQLEGILCHSKCRFQCSETVDLDSRRNLFEAFYSMTSGGQDAYLFGCIQSFPPKTRLCNAERPREFSAVYSVKIEGENVRVCKKAFQILHCVSEAKVAHIVRQVRDGFTAARQSIRGKHVNRPNRIADEQREYVRSHIQSFPAEQSHYSRARNENRMYLSSTLTIGIMFNDYKKKCFDNGQKAVSESMYRQIFCSDFNLGFGSPRSDTCAKCETIADADQLEAHKQAATVAFQQQRADREEAKAGKSVYITFDMEKTLPLPKLSVGEAFYLRQLWLYNVGIHVVTDVSERPYFQIWTEDQGGRGLNEVCSALFTFFNMSGIGDQTPHLVAWSDSCSGQNKNFGTLCFWQYMVLSNKLASVVHKFPEPGHSYLDSDRDFAQIEKAVKRRENIYSVDEYQTLIVNAFHRNRATVTRIGDKFFDIKKLCTDLGLKKQTFDVHGSKIEMRDKVRCIRITEFGRYSYRHSLSEQEDWKDVVLTKRVMPACPALTLLPQHKRPVKATKVSDLNKQLRFIPEVYHSLYTGLLSTSTNTDNEDAEEDEPEAAEQSNMGDEVCY